ncbi:MAG TPA: class I SAM-dependent methyltransferase [Solirubrobacterales bacterium]|nr:class I SAM-dependent methyltransferase [Solirubrobacterales bacterium]
MHESNDFIDNLQRLSSATWAYAALAAALELGMLERLAEPIHEPDVAERCGVEPELAADIVEALVAIGALQRRDGLLVPAPSFEMLLSPSLARVLHAEIRGDHIQTRGLVHRAREGEPLCGWRLEDPVALTAQGETGSLIGLLVEALSPGLDGLQARMGAPGARILDVGAGVGVVSIELCRLWPAAEAVGLEPHRTARELGRSRIAAAGLSDRIALRDERLEMLGERAAYDVAFLPQPFLPRDAVEQGLPRLLEALRPGGWLIVLASELPADDPLVAAARRFRARVWGGGVIETAELKSALAGAGFDAARTDHPVASFRAICARRPLSGSTVESQAGVELESA